MSNRETRKTSETVNRLTNGIILLGAFFGFLAVAFSATRILELFGTGVSLTFYFGTSILGLTTSIVFLTCLRLAQEFKRNILLMVFSISIPVLCVESYLSIVPRSSDANAVGLSIMGDQRSKIQVIDDLNVDGITAYPNLSGSMFLETNGIPGQSGSQEILPIGSISNTKSVYCNESGYWTIFHSDEHGFNNPLNNYISGQVDVMLTGDSFTEGACVKPKETIAAILRKTGLRVISLGKGGNGTLLEYASFVEYIKPIQPKIVIWMHYANDLRDLSHKELRSSILRGYLEDEEYSQGLIFRQKEIDAALTRFIGEKYVEQKATLALPAPTRNGSDRPVDDERPSDRFAGISIIEILKLTRLRELIGLRPGRPDPVLETATVFRLLLQRAKESTAKWGGRLYLAYLPQYERYQTGRDHDVFYKDFVLRTASTLEIPIIDIHKEVFKSHPDPLSLFPQRKARHYNARGYKLTAGAIHGRLLDDAVFR